MVAELKNLTKLLILIVDDEPDIHAVTKLSLKSMQYQDRSVEFLTASSGAECVEILRGNPDIAVILLDVVMESDSAGLDACRAIREEVGNHVVRILLRTGQPGSAPEKETIDQYDLDGYLPKADLTSSRLYSGVRTALKAWMELVELERHRHYLSAIHDAAMSLHSFDPLAYTLERILETALEISPGKLAVLMLETFSGEGDPQQYFLHLSNDDDPVESATTAEDIRNHIANNETARQTETPIAFEGGILVPVVLHHELGRGWFFIANAETDNLSIQALTLLSGHAANALYSAVAQSVLENADSDKYDSIAI